MSDAISPTRVLRLLLTFGVILATSAVFAARPAGEIGKD